MATKEKDIFGASFTTGDYVMVRCLVTSISPTIVSPYWGGSGDNVHLTVETPCTNDKAGVTLIVSPQQCRKCGDSNQG